MEERRKFRRYEMNKQCLVRHPEMVGILMDLSLGGLSCECIGTDAEPPCHTVDLLCHESSTWVGALNLDLVSTARVPGEFLPNFWSRKCRARFTELREEQADLLESYILTYALQRSIASGSSKSSRRVRAEALSTPTGSR